MKKAIPLLLASVLTFACTKQERTIPDYTSFIEKYRKILTAELNTYHLRGLSIAIVDGDSLVWCEGFGTYGQAQSPVTGHTPFNIGSVCKTFTGISVMQLQEHGMLHIDDPYQKYVPGFSMHSRFGSPDSVTIRSMLTHHAGIPDFIRDKLLEKPPYFTKVLEYVNDDYATFAPNTNFSYSNAGISLLGNLIESVSGESYYDYVQDHILEPLQMTESGFVNGDLPESVWLGYNGRGEEQKELQVVDAPAGCVYSSAYDMAKYVKSLLLKGKPLMEEGSFTEMTRIQNSGVFLDLGNPVGLTWNIYYNDAGECIEHAGGTINHRAELCVAPEAGIGIIIMSNSANSGQCMFRVNYEMFNEIMKLKGLPPITHKKPPANILHPEHNFLYKDDSIPHKSHLSTAELERYTGFYGTFGMLYQMKLQEGKLWTDIWGQNWYLLPVRNGEFVSSPDTIFKHADPKTRYYFEWVNGRHVFIQATETGKQQIFGEKVDAKPLSQVWRKRLGTYQSTGEISSYQMFSDFRLLEQQGLLVMKANVHIEFGPPEILIPMQVVNDDLAVIPGYDRFCGSTLRFEVGPDKQEILKFMGFTCVKN